MTKLPRKLPYQVLVNGKHVTSHSTIRAATTTAQSIYDNAKTTIKIEVISTGQRGQAFYQLFYKSE